MRIIQLIYSLSSGGAEKFVVDLSNQLAEMGHDVTLCTLRNIEDERLSFNRQYLGNKVKFHSMSFERGFTLGKCKELETFIKECSPDILHCHLNVIPYIFKLALSKNSPVIFHTLHNIASETGGRGVQYYLNRFFYKKNKIHPVCISQICQQSYEEYYKLYNAPVIDNGRAIVSKSAKFKDVKQEVDSYRKTIQTKVFLHVARFNKQKNQQLLIDAFNCLKAHGCDFILLVIGSGFDNAEAFNLKATACDRVFFLGEKNNVTDYLYCSDAFCLTSKYEGLPISLLEALSCGITPICTPVGGIPDVIHDGVNGYLSLGQDVDAYCHAVKRYIERPLPPQELVKYFKENFSMEKCARKYEVLYSNVQSHNKD